MRSFWPARFHCLGAGVLAALCITASLPDLTLAASASARAIKPSSFALPLSALPLGSQIRLQGVESNSAAQSSLVPHLGSHTLAQLNRHTGYYMDSVQPNNGHAIYTQYLVSIFGSTQQATVAFDQQQAGYNHLSRLMPGHYTSAVSHRGFGTNDGFGTSLITVNGKPFYTREEYFSRRRVLVEVVQSYFVSDSKPYGHNARSYVWSIAARLDAVAHSSR